MNNNFQGNNTISSSNEVSNSINNSNIPAATSSSNSGEVLQGGGVENSIPVSNTPIVNPVSNNKVQSSAPVSNIPIVNPVSNNKVQSSAPVSNIPIVNPVNTGVIGGVSQVNNEIPSSATVNISSANPIGNSVENSSLQGKVLNSDSSGNGGSVSLDNQKKVDIEYKPPSKGKIIFMIFSFIILLLFVIFLPEISSMINLYKSGAYNKTEEKITTGSMKCSLKTNTSNLDKIYDLLFKFKNNKLEKTEFVITTKGNPTEDEQSLDNLAGICTQLEESLKDVTGVYIRCNYTTGQLVEKQAFDLGAIDFEQLNSAFSEAGGNNPEYQFGQDIDIIERSMNASGYTCTREK